MQPVSVARVLSGLLGSVSRQRRKYWAYRTAKAVSISVPASCSYVARKSPVHAAGFADLERKDRRLEAVASSERALRNGSIPTVATSEKPQRGRWSQRVSLYQTRFHNQRYE